MIDEPQKERRVPEATGARNDFLVPAIVLLIIGFVFTIVVMEDAGNSEPKPEPKPESKPDRNKPYVNVHTNEVETDRRTYWKTIYEDYRGTEAKGCIEDGLPICLEFRWSNQNNGNASNWGHVHYDLDLDFDHDPDALLKNMNWRGSFIIYDNPTPGGPEIVVLNDEFVAPPQVPENLSRIRQATMREYRCFLSVFSRHSLYEGKGFPHDKFDINESENSALSDTYKIYVKILYRKLKPYPDYNGNPVYADSNIYYKIVSLDASTAESAILRVSPNKDNPTRGISWNEELVDAKARGGYRRWWQKGRSSAEADFNSVAIESQQKPGWYIHEWEMSREEAFPKDTEDIGMVSEVPEEFDGQY